MNYSFTLLFIPLLLQGLAIGVDEFYFHKKRGLGKWERIGHPVDTFFMLACIGVTLLFKFSDGIVLYSVLSVFSCLIITKDEWIHTKECPPAEMWLHAVLFVLHPISLCVIGYIWYSSLLYTSLFWFLSSLFFGVFVLFVYQIGYWNVYKQRIRKN